MKISININEIVRVKLTDRGRQIHQEIWDDLIKFAPSLGPYEPKKEDSEGWSEWQLWSLMSNFGQYCGMGCEPCFEINIELVSRW